MLYQEKSKSVDAKRGEPISFYNPFLALEDDSPRPARRITCVFEGDYIPNIGHVDKVYPYMVHAGGRYVTLGELVQLHIEPESSEDAMVETKQGWRSYSSKLYSVS